MASATVRSMQEATLPCQLAGAPGAALPNYSRLSLARIPHSQLPLLFILRQAKLANGQHLLSKRQVVVSAEYSGRRSGGGAGDFVAGFLLGGVLFGAIGYLIAPTISKSIAAAESHIGHHHSCFPPLHPTASLHTKSPSKIYRITSQIS